jgi:organic radical activating enzyme
MNIIDVEFNEQTKKFKKKFVEFYITNVCNFNCDNCNRLNNYYFSGHESWKLHKDTYKVWSEKIDFENILILGGEPLLHPNLPEWMIGLRSLWPSAEIKILSNGSRLEYWERFNLFDLLSETKIQLEISLHNRARRLPLLDELQAALNQPTIAVTQSEEWTKWTDAYNTVKDPSWPNCDSYKDFEKLPEWIQTECRDQHKIDWDEWALNTGKTTITDSTRPGLVVTLLYAENFVTAPLQYAGNDKFKVYNSDPDSAHKVCWAKYCTHIMGGKMYKCHHVALLPEFIKQFQVEIDSEDMNLLDSYQPLESTASTEVMDDFLENLKKPMPQCKLCPSKLLPIKLQSSTDKPKVKKIIPIKKHADSR